MGELHEVSAREGRGEWSPRTQHALRLRLAGAPLAQSGFITVVEIFRAHCCLPLPSLGFTAASDMMSKLQNATVRSFLKEMCYNGFNATSKRDNKELHFLFPLLPPGIFHSGLHGCRRHFGLSDCQIYMIRRESLTCQAVNTSSVYNNMQCPCINV